MVEIKHLGDKINAKNIILITLEESNGASKYYFIGYYFYTINGDSVSITSD